MEGASMRMTFFVVSKSWVSNPLRTILSILGIGIGVAIVTAIHVMDHNTIQSRLRQANPDFGRVDFELTPHDKTRDARDVRSELSKNPDIKDIGIYHPAAIVLKQGDKQIGMASLFGLYPLPNEAFSHYVVIDGEDLTDLDGDSSVLITETIARIEEIGVGDTVDLAQPTSAPRSICKDGRRQQQETVAQTPVSVTATVKGIIAHRYLGRRDLGQVVIGSYSLAHKLAPLRHSLFQVNRKYGADIDRIRSSLSDTFQVSDDRSALLGEASDERAFRNGVKILGCLALVLGMFIVFQTLSQSLVERLKQIGLLRCLGTSRTTVSMIFLTDAFLMAIVGVALGILGGVALAWAMKAAGYSTLGEGKDWSTFEIPYGPILWTGAVGLLFTLAGAAFPLYKARKLSAIDALNAKGLGGADKDVLRGVNLFLFMLLLLVLPAAYLAMTPILSESEYETLIVLGQLGGMILLFGALLLLAPGLVRVLGNLALIPIRLLLPLPGFLVSKSLQQNSGRFASSVCGLAIVLLALIGLSSITLSLKGEAREFAQHATHQRLFALSEGMQLKAADIEPLRQIPGVTSVDALEGQATVPFLLSGLRLQSLVRKDGVLEAFPKEATRYATQRSMIVSRRLAALYDMREDSSFTVLTDTGKVPYLVLKISDDAGFFPDEHAWAITNPKWLQEDFCIGASCVSHLSIRMDRKQSHEAIRTEIKRRLPSIGWSKTGKQLLDYSLRDVNKDFGLFDVLLSLILCIAGMGLLNAMTIAALGRVREIGVLRALGMSRKQLHTTFLLEGLLVGCLAAGTALAMGIPLGWVIIDGLNRVAGLDAPYVLPEKQFLMVPLIGITVGTLAAWVPGIRASRQSPAESVRYE